MAMTGKARYIVTGMWQGMWSEHDNVRGAYYQMRHNHRYMKRMGWDARVTMTRIYSGETPYQPLSIQVF